MCLVVSTLFCWFVSCFLYLMLFYIFSFSFFQFFVRIFIYYFRIIGIMRTYTKIFSNKKIYFIVFIKNVALHL